MITHRSLMLARAAAVAFAAPAFASRQPRQSGRAARAGAGELQGASSTPARACSSIEVTRDLGAATAPTASTIWCKNGFYDNVPLLPRDLRLHGAVRHQRRSGGIGDWRDGAIKDDPVTQSNKRGYHHLRDGRAEHAHHQVFINFGDNARLDSQGFSPFGQVVSGMDVVDKLNAEYGEGAPRGRGPDQSRMQTEGNAYLAKDFPRMDFVKKATIER